MAKLYKKIALTNKIFSRQNATFNSKIFFQTFCVTKSKSFELQRYLKKFNGQPIFKQLFDFILKKNEIP